MRPITNEDIKILGRLVNISTEGVVADASQVYDSTQHKNQETINSEMKNKTKNATTTTYGIVRLASGKNDADNTDVPTIKILRDAIQDAVNQLLEDPNGSLLDNLNSIKELAESLNNDPNFYNWVTTELAKKADKSALDTLAGQVNNLDQRVTTLEVCCEQVKEYLDNFSITWNAARGGDKVVISPSVLKGGRNVVVFDVDPDYMISETLTSNNIGDYIDGNYDTVTITNFTDAGMTLTFTGVRSNIVINAHIVRRMVNVTRTVTGDAKNQVQFSNTNDTQNANRAYICTISVSDKDQFAIDGETSRVFIGEEEYGLGYFLSGQFYTSPWASDESCWKIKITIPASVVTDDIHLVINTAFRGGRVTINYVNASAPYDHHTTDVAYFDGQEYEFGVIPYDGYYFPTDGLNGETGQDGYTYVNLDDPSYITRNPELGAIWQWGVQNTTGYGSVVINDSEFTQDCTVTITAQPIHTVTHSISYVGLSTFHANNDASTVNDNDSFSTSFTRNAGTPTYGTISVTKVTMGGTDITTSATSGSHAVDIDHVTGDVVITVSEVYDDPFSDGTVTISVSNGSASPATVVSDSFGPYTSTITPDSGYTLTGA